MQLTAQLGHPDQSHFPSSTLQHLVKKKSPSQLRRQERRRQEVFKEKTHFNQSEKNVVEDATVLTTEKSMPSASNPEASTETPRSHIKQAKKPKTNTEKYKTFAGKLDYSTKNSLPSVEKANVFKCDQCYYENSSEKVMVQHVRMKHCPTLKVIRSRQQHIDVCCDVIEDRCNIR